MRYLTCLIVLLLWAPVQEVQAQNISEQDLLEHIEILASDNFGGRKPGTHGENKTVSYIATQWKNAGLRPATGSSSWYAPVALMDRTPLKQSFTFVMMDEGREKTIRIDDDQIVLRGREPLTSLSSAPVIFAGYGNQSAEEMKPAIAGKLALIFLSSPQGVLDFPDFRTRKANVIAAGASGVIAVVNRKSRYDSSARRFRRVNTSLSEDGYHAEIEGQISAQAADRLLDKAGLDYKQLVTNAALDGFRPIDTGIYADMNAETRVRSYQSHNVIGKIAGSKPESGAVLFLGHWDHLGECRSEPEVDRICNGAVDNASGIALLIEVAERLADSQPDRDIFFLATTAEESGLLGARAFVADPGFPLERLVAVFNADTIALSPTGERIAVVGLGQTDLDEDIKTIAASEGREIDDTDGPNSFLKRQDGYVFLEKNIPAFMITSAFSDKERLDSYLNGRYHDVGDEADEALLLGGAADDADFHVALGRYFSSIDTFPSKTMVKNETD